ACAAPRGSGARRPGSWRASAPAWTRWRCWSAPSRAGRCRRRSRPTGGTTSRASTTSSCPSGGSRSRRCSLAARRATTACSPVTPPSCRRSSRSPRRVASSGEPLTILLAARDEAGRIGETVGALRARIPGAEVIVADDGSRDGTAAEAEAAGATVLRLRRRGKGQALSAAERAAPPGRLLLVDADLRGDPGPLLESAAELAIARFARRQGGGFGIAKRTGAALIRLASGFEAREPLSGQRAP